MKPDEPDNRSISVPHRDQPSQSARPDGRDGAVQLMRDQIDRIYDGHQPDATTSSSDQIGPRASNHHDWQNYHTQWQQYYQQYYERYYLQQVEKHRLQHNSPTDSDAAQPQAGDQPAKASAGLSRDQAVGDIRNELLGKIQAQSSRVRKSRHFVPVLSALAVMLVFLLLQYNRLMIAQVKAFVSPGSLTSQNLIVDPLESTKVGPEPRLIIPKINVDAPVVYSLNSLSESAVQTALKDGVVHYPIPGASSLPGEQGNSVILGHSSNDVFDDGNYKFIFVQLEQMQPGDTFYVNFQGTRYTYTVSRKEVILPTQVGKLAEAAGKPQMLLVTCVPVGTALKRLVVYADQISPDPAKATAATQTAPDNASLNSISGNSPSLLDRLFGR